MKGRKRHLLVDTQGLLLKVVVSAADVQDRDGARLLAHAVRLYGPHLPRLSLVWADAAYAGQLVEDLRQLDGLAGRGGQTRPTPSRAAPLPYSPIGGSSNERSAGSVASAACAKDYEYQVESSEALIYAAMSHLMLRKLTRSSAPSSPAG